MSKPTALGVPEPEEPSKPLTWEQMVSAYRTAHRSALSRVRSVLDAPIRKTAATLQESTTR